jgi:aminopeptidase 2
VGVMKERRLWGRWPQGFRPLHYELSLAFTFDVEGHLLSDYYEGSVSIAVGGMVGRHLSLDWAQQEGRQLKFVRVDGIPAQVTTELDTQDTCVLETEVEMQDTCVIEIEFTGIISHSADTGLYVCSCDGFPLVATHLEPGYAHHVFPCFDSPRYRPRISLTLIGIPDSLSAFSNSSCGERIATSSGSQTRFHCTQEMPIYLFGFWIGPFTVLQKSLEPPLPQTVSAVVPAGQRVEEAQFGLNLACRALGFFHNLLGCAVPITKLDIICVPRLHGMAMEGFGAITVLCDFFLVNAATPVARKRRVARLICHEILHQWIGDHVSCRSFDDLWLKEGLARLFEFDAVEVLCPEHAIWANFIEDVVFQAQLHDAWVSR